MDENYTRRTVDQMYSIASSYVSYLHRNDSASISIEDFVEEVENTVDKLTNI